MRTERFSIREFDAGGMLSTARLAEIRAQLDLHGALHVTHTGLTDAEGLRPKMADLGFSPGEQFEAGGRTAEGFQPKWFADGLRRLDFYPPDLYLLPNNEVQYQRCGPARVLFYCQRAPAAGGRTFLHSAADIADGLARSAVGSRLLVKLRSHGLMIQTGFLDSAHPAKSTNYFQSWQERFGTTDPDEALSIASRRTDEYDRCWWKPEETGHATLMTAIVLSAFKRDPRDGREYLRFPRLALGPPSVENGWRCYPLGNGVPLNAAEAEALMTVYLETRQGTDWSDGDLVLFDNIRYGHSRERFEGERPVFVGMAGVVWDDAVAPPAPPPEPRLPARFALPGPVRYRLPSAHIAEQVSMRTFDARGDLTPACCPVIRAQLDRYGALLIRRTGLTLPDSGALSAGLLDALGFGSDQAFAWGGLSSGRTIRRALSRHLRATDDYPPEHWLLPHNEILYQRQMPARLLLCSAQAVNPAHGGRTFVHSAALVADHIRAAGPLGARLLADLAAHGFLIEMGFLDANHPAKSTNYFRSWQDRFDTTDPDGAQARCRAARDQFDDCWWKEDDGTATLMTRIRIPAFKIDPRDGQRYMLFPRIALDAPSLHNGWRRFPLGCGRSLTDREVDLLLSAFLATREGLHYHAGDLLLIDNIRYGHSREAFLSPRSVGVAMGGSFWTDDVV
ncbi:MAG: TauD/TfdA family dioxygenase [Myxococcota bacterium]|nr:TauD/TfdA family dioxygenase [Myxococcota bacterium]